MMNAKRRYWAFDRAKWATSVREQVHEYGTHFVAAYMGVHPGTVGQWAKQGSTTDDFPYPTMTNFLLYVKEFDVNPGDFFVLVEE